MMSIQQKAATQGPLVSIIAPCYNAGTYLECAIDSIFAQDYEPFEVIIVDDGSTDDSYARLQALQARYPFQLYRQPNQGVSAALNHGLRHARGVFVATPDLDDIMLPFSVRIRAEYLNLHPQVGIVGALITYMDCEGKDLKCQHREEVECLHFDEVVRGAVVVGAPVALYRMQALRDAGGYDPAIRVQDFQITLRIAARGYRIDVLPVKVTRYRRHPNNLSRNYKVLLDADLQALSSYIDHPDYPSAKAHALHKALKYAVVSDKPHAWKLLRDIPFKYMNTTTWRRFKRLVLHR
ncbi:glycosyltransferase family A protein [Pseudomonas syringae]|nr:glycosyltransferase family 2 protein [Pseudomonas syringae]